MAREGQEKAIDVGYVAGLARIELDADEAARLEAELGSILEYMELLGELDTSEVEPTSHPVPLTTALREDEVAGELPRREALANAPHQDGIAFVVPRVL